MDKENIEQLEMAEKLIETGAYKKSLSILYSLMKKYSTEGRILFDIGRISFVLSQYDITEQFFEMAMDNGYKNIQLFLLFAQIKSINGQQDQAEDYYLKAIQFAEANGDKNEKWLVYSLYAQYEIENKAYLKAEKYSKILRREYANNYQGCHIHFLILMDKKMYAQAEAYLQELLGTFKNNIQYLMDTMQLLEVQNKDLQEEGYMESDFLKQSIPRYFLRKEIQCNVEAEQYDEAENALLTLASKYHDSGSYFPLMILFFSKGDYEKASKIALQIMKDKVSAFDFEFFFAVYYQIFSLYLLADKKPSQNLRSWIEKAGNWCIDFAAKSGLEELYQAVDHSIDQLFNEINENGNCN